MEEQATLTAYLSPPLVASDGLTIKSSLWAALLDIRAVTKRSAATGVVEDPEGSRAWIGALGYLSLLDQLGTAVARPSRPNSIHSNGILRALLAFADLDGDQLDAVVALRNAFAHDYSLVSIDSRPGKSGRTHRFSLNIEPGMLVSVPQDRWSGSFDPIDGSDTVMSLRGVGDLAESVVAEAQRCNAVGDLQIGLPGGAREMQTRYFLMYVEPAGR